MLGGKEGVVAPFPSYMGAGEQELPFILNSFNPTYLVKGHFPAL